MCHHGFNEQHSCQGNNCDTLDLNGTWGVAINGSDSGVNDQLIVNGTLDIGSGSILNVTVNGSLQYEPYKQSWIIITSTGGAINDFGSTFVYGGSGLYFGPNFPSNGDYSFSLPGSSSFSSTSGMGGSMGAGAARGGMGSYVLTGSISGLSAHSQHDYGISGTMPSRSATASTRPMG